MTLFVYYYYFDGIKINMDFNSTFNSPRRQYRNESNGSFIHPVPRFNRKHEESLTRTDDSFQISTINDESLRSNSSIGFQRGGLERRSTVAGFDSSFNTRRRVMLQSTPINSRRIGERVIPAPNFDVSDITTVNENEENKQRAVEDRSYGAPHFFGTVEEKPRPPSDTFVNKFMDYGMFFSFCLMHN